MLVPKDYIVERARDARIDLYIPTYFIDVDTDQQKAIYHKDGFVELSDDLFMRLKRKKNKIYIASNSNDEDFMLYPSEAGWNYMKESVLSAFENRKVYRWSSVKGFERELNAKDFETIVEEFYENMRHDGYSYSIDVLCDRYMKNEVKQGRGV